MRILIIDDEKNIRRTLCNILEDESHICEAAGSIQEGMALLDSFDPHAILLDVLLPDGNGIQALESIRHHLPNIPVIQTAPPTRMSATMTPARRPEGPDLEGVWRLSASK